MIVKSGAEFCGVRGTRRGTRYVRVAGTLGSLVYRAGQMFCRLTHLCKTSRSVILCDRQEWRRIPDGWSWPWFSACVEPQRSLGERRWSRTRERTISARSKNSWCVTSRSMFRCDRGSAYPAAVAVVKGRGRKLPPPRSACSAAVCVRGCSCVTL